MKKSKKEENNNTFHSSDSEFDNNFNDYTGLSILYIILIINKM